MKIPSRLLGRNLLILLTLASALALGAERGSAQRGRGKQSPAPQWYDGTLDAARAEALERNTPLIIFAILEGEEESDRFRDGLLKDSRVGQECERAIPILVNAGEHKQRKIKEKDEDGEVIERSVCSVYGTKNCEVHRRNWDRVYLDYTSTEGDGNWILPEGLVLKPDGSLFKRHHDGDPPDLGSILRSLSQARSEAGFGLLRSELRMVKGQKAHADAMMRAGSHGDAWQAWHAIHALIPSGKYHTQAEEGMEKALEGMHIDLEDALSILIPGMAREGYLRLLEMRETYVNSPLEKNVEAALKRCERDKLIKEEIAQLKLELAAEEIWEQIEAKERAGDEKGAKRLAKKLLGKKYRETPAGKRAREKYGDD